MKYFITGGAGFIGSHFVRMLLSDSAETPERVTVLDKFTYSGCRKNLADFEGHRSFNLIEADICNADSFKSLLDEHDVVIHFAAESHVDRSIESASAFVRTNVLGTQSLLECSLNAGINIFVHVSTDEVYGSIENGSWTEEQPLLPNSPYAASKAGSDLVARSYYQTYGMDIRITRCSNNFGTHQFPEKMIPLFVTNLIDGLKVPLYGDGLNVRDWLHVEDHCDAILKVVQSGKAGDIYNVGGGTEMTNRDLTLRIIDFFGKDYDVIEHVQDRKGHDRRYSVDWSKIRTELGYQPKRNFEEELEKVVYWYRHNESWWRPLKEKNEFFS